MRLSHLNFRYIDQLVKNKLKTINELKTTLMAQLMIDGAPEDTDLVRALQRQATIQKSVYDIQRETLEEDQRRSQLVTRMDFLDLKTSLEQKIEDIADTMKKALEALSERVAMCEEQKKGSCQPF